MGDLPLVLLMRLAIVCSVSSVIERVLDELWSECSAFQQATDNNLDTQSCSN
jgi:hypothetical protein